MEFWKFWQNLITEKSKTNFFGRILSENSPDTSNSIQLVPNKFYLKIELKSLYIKDARKWANTYYGVVHSFISVPHITGENLEFNVVSTPSKLLEIDSKHIDRVIIVNMPLLGSIPYRGVNVNLEVGLFSVVSSKLTKPILDFFSEMSSVAGVSYITSALPYAKFLDKGIGILSATDDNPILEVGISTMLSKIEPGYYVLIQAEKSKIEKDDLVITPDDYRLSHKNGSEYLEYPYMVLEISASKNRNDWFMIPEIKKAYKDLNDGIREDKNEDEVSELLSGFKRSLYTSGDLLLSDAEKIFRTVKKTTDKITKITRSQGTGKQSLPAPEKLKIF